jgi:hypothetical protein
VLGVSIGIVLADLQLSKYWSNICHPKAVRLVLIPYGLSHTRIINGGRPAGTN